MGDPLLKVIKKKKVIKDDPLLVFIKEGWVMSRCRIFLKMIPLLEFIKRGILNDSLFRI